MVTHSVEEALLLADRVYVLSAKPTTVLHEVHVPFARPRTETTRSSAAFQQLASALFEMLVPGG
jgi:ABC-type nitrate/sulfonate/bicarbonate transport system ATPase subunit